MNICTCPCHITDVLCFLLKCGRMYTFVGNLTLPFEKNYMKVNASFFSKLISVAITWLGSSNQNLLLSDTTYAGYINA